LSEPERLRLVSVAYKLGEMAEMLQRPREEERGWLELTVKEVLSLLTTMQTKDSRVRKATTGAGAGDVKAGQDAEQAAILMNELNLPDWLSKSVIGASFEALGAFYARTGQLE
jgi:hypothetical protein